MTRRARFHLLPLFLLCGTSAFASAPQAAAFGPGEQLKYEISYLGITGAHAQITVGAETEQFGKTVWPIVAHANTDAKLAFYPVRDKFVTYWDHAQSRSVGSEFIAQENKHRRRQRIQLDHDARTAKVFRQHEGKAPVERTHEITAGAGDVAAAAFQLRNLPLAVGREFEVPVFTGQKSFQLKAKVDGVEKMDTEIGEKEVFRVRVQTSFSGKFASKRDVFAFITTDERRVPVRIDADFVLGTLKAEIVDYKEGRRVALNPPAKQNPLQVASEGPGAN